MRGDILRRGDIVEMNVGFIVIETAEGKVLKTVLRSVCLLNDQFAKVRDRKYTVRILMFKRYQEALKTASKAANGRIQKTEPHKLKIKRSRAYQEDGIETIDAGVKLLRLSQGNRRSTHRGDTEMANPTA